MHAPIPCSCPRRSRATADGATGARSGGARSEEVPINENALARLVALSDQVRARIPDASAPTVSEVLRWPGVLGETDLGATLTPIAIEAGREALAGFIAFFMVCTNYLKLP